MKTVEETRRELFRAWFDEQQSIAERCGVSLGQTESDLMEAGFNAALDCVVIELPKPCAFESLDSAGVFVQLTYEISGDSKDPVDLARLADCRAAIESTNLGIKVK